MTPVRANTPKCRPAPPCRLAPTQTRLMQAQSSTPPLPTAPLSLRSSKSSSRAQASNGGPQICQISAKFTCQTHFMLSSVRMKVRTKTQVVTVFALIAALSTTANTTAAVAHTAPVESDHAISQIETDAYISEFGVSRLEAKRRLELQTTLDGPIAEIVAAEGDRVAGFGIEHTPSFAGVVYLSGESPHSATSQAVLENWGELLQIRVGYRHSIKELLTAIELIPYSIKEDAEYIDINIQSNNIEIGALSDSFNQVSAAVARLPWPIKVTKTTKSRLHATLEGGQPLTTCTAGFSVENSAGIRGISTAAHCGNSQSQSGVSMTYAGGAHNSNMDVQWHTAAGHTIVDDFYNGTGFTDVGSVISRSNSSGDFVCHRGKNSGTSCGYVTSIYHAPSDCGGQTCSNVFVKVEGSSLKGCRGDSGGPWYNGNQAYGNHHGGSSSNASDCTAIVNYLSFTSSTYFSNIGISILTS